MATTSTSARAAFFTTAISEYLREPCQNDVILQRQGDVYRPGSRLRKCLRGFGNDGTALVTWDSLGYHSYKGFFPDSFLGHVGNNFSWTDMNGDNLVQPDEMHWVKVNPANYQPGMQPNLGAYWGWDVSPDWSYFSAGPSMIRPPSSASTSRVGPRMARPSTTWPMRGRSSLAPETCDYRPSCHERPEAHRQLQLRRARTN